MYQKQDACKASNMKQKMRVIDKVVDIGLVRMSKNVMAYATIHIDFNGEDSMSLNDHIYGKGKPRNNLSICGNLSAWVKNTRGVWTIGESYAHGGGQCHERIAKGIYKPADGLTKDMVLTIMAMWRDWHMNEYNHACEHQKTNPDFDHNAEVAEWIYSRGKVYDNTERLILSGQCGSFHQYKEMCKELSETEKAISYDGKRFSGDVGEAPSAFKKLFEKGFIDIIDKKKRRAGELFYYNNPQGLLGKTCAECGFEYGDNYRLEVPESVLDMLEALPEGGGM